MWMVDPTIMCRQHLLGEHRELHTILGSAKKGISLRGYVESNTLELHQLQARHDALAVEMARRGYNHKTPLDADLSYLADHYPYEWKSYVERASALTELLRRCPHCRENQKTRRIAP